MSNCFTGRTDGYNAPGVKFEDKPYGVYALTTKAELDPDTKEPIIVNKVIKTDEIKFQKIIDTEAKGSDLKSLVAKVSSTGDLSLLNQRKAVYGDGYKIPRKMEDVLQKGIETGAILEKVTPDQLALIRKLDNMTVDERKAFISKFAKKKEVKQEPIKQEPVQPVVNESEVK